MECLKFLTFHDSLHTVSSIHWEMRDVFSVSSLGSLLERVERGEEVVITRHGKPVARLVPNTGGIDRAQARAAAERIRMRAVKLKAGRFDWEKLKADRDADRP